MSILRLSSSFMLSLLREGGRGMCLETIVSIASCAGGDIIEGRSNLDFVEDRKRTDECDGWKIISSRIGRCNSLFLGTIITLIGRDRFRGSGS